MAPSPLMSNLEGVTFRKFHNFDPPEVLRLWRWAGLGRGAVKPSLVDVFELTVFSLPYFDPEGLILAECDGKAVGYVHAGFAINSEQNALDQSTGLICALIVHPDYRRRGIGTELLAKAEEYLKARGATKLIAGGGFKRDPFYVGLYGGIRHSGFLESDPMAKPFFEKHNYGSLEQYGIFQRDYAKGSDPINFRLVTIRRRFELRIRELEKNLSWWWVSRFGKFDALRFELVSKSDQQALAGVTVIGMDLFISAWQQRFIGLIDLFVDHDERRKGYGQALLVEVARRMRQESIDGAEMHIPLSSDMLQPLMKVSDFTQVDTAETFIKSPE